MNVLCLSNDELLCGKIKNCTLFKRITISEEINLGTEDRHVIDVVLMTDTVVPFEMLPDFREHYSHSLLFYIAGNMTDHKLFRKVETMCYAHDINIVYPRQTHDQIVAYICNVLKPRDEVNNHHVTAFVGAQPRVGVTTTTMAVATRLGMSTEAKIGVLGLNSWNPGTVYIKGYQGSYLDDLKTKLSNSMLSSTQLLKEMHQYNHFYYLAGNRDIKKRLHYSIKDIYYLIEQAKKVYDLVLIDAGSNYDDALCIQSLLNADTKLLVTNQEISGLYAWQKAYEQILAPTGIGKQDFLMIINQYKNIPQLPDLKQLSQDYGMPCLRHVGDLGDMGVIVEANQNLLINYHEPEYIREIDFIVRALVKTYKLNTKNNRMISKESFIRRIFG